MAARLAADVLDVPTVLIARTDAHSAALLTSDIDEVDRGFCSGERTPDGFFRVNQGVKVSMPEWKSLFSACGNVVWCSASSRLANCSPLHYVKLRQNSAPMVPVWTVASLCAGIHCSWSCVCSIR